MLYQVIRLSRRALWATKVIRGWDGRLLGVPDHQVRLEAVGLFIKLSSTAAFTAIQQPTLRQNVCISSQSKTGGTGFKNRCRIYKLKDGIDEPAHHKARLEGIRITLIRIFRMLGRLNNGEPLAGYRSFARPRAPTLPCTRQRLPSSLLIESASARASRLRLPCLRRGTSDQG